VNIFENNDQDKYHHYFSFKKIISLDWRMIYLFYENNGQKLFCEVTSYSFGLNVHQCVTKKLWKKNR